MSAQTDSQAIDGLSEELIKNPGKSLKPTQRNSRLLENN